VGRGDGTGLEAVRPTAALEPEMAARTDEQMRTVTGELRGLLSSGADLDVLLPRVFAAVREAARRTLGQRHVDEQIAAGAALHRGALVEMKTGEGKTLAATLPAYLAGLDGAGVHVLTASDYLARRDFEWMAPVFRFLGLDCGLVVGQSTPGERRAAYGAQVTYGGWEQFGYDYLRDNMAWSAKEFVQRGQAAAIVDGPT
jgi:preprotein translocase subunit SecA